MGLCSIVCCLCRFGMILGSQRRSQQELAMGLWPRFYSSIEFGMAAQQGGDGSGWMGKDSWGYHGLITIYMIYGMIWDILFDVSENCDEPPKANWANLLLEKMTINCQIFKRYPHGTSYRTNTMARNHWILRQIHLKDHSAG